MLPPKRRLRLLAILLAVSPSLVQANTTTASNHNEIDEGKTTTQRHPPKHELLRANRRLQRQRIHEFARSSSLSAYIRCVGNNGVTTLQRPYVPCKRGNRGNGRPTNTGNDNLNSNNVLETSPKLYTRGGSSLGSLPGSPPALSPLSSTLDGAAATKPPQSATHHDLIQTGETLGGVQEGDHYGYSVQITSDSSGSRFIAIGSNKYSMVGGERGTCCTGKIQAFTLTFNGPNGSQSWSSHGQNLFGESPSMEFGAAVSISDDGTVLSGAGRLYTSLYRFNADAARWHEFVYEQKMPGIIVPRLSQNGQRMVARTINNAVTLQGYMGANTTPNWKPLGKSGLVGAIAGVISGHGKRMVTVTSQYAINTYRYEPTQNNLNQVGQVLNLENNPNSNTVLNNNHVSLAMSLMGDIFAVSYKNNVRAYRFKNRQWSLIATEIQGSDLDKGGYGYDISVSDRGSRIAIGSPFYNNYQGRVEVYHVYREVWTKICYTIEGEEMGAYAGHAVSIAPDGYHVAVGSPFIGSSTHVGNVRVYELKPSFNKAAAPAPAPAPAPVTAQDEGHDTEEESDGTAQSAGDNANSDGIDDAGTINNNDGDTTNQVADDQMEHAMFDGKDQDNASSDGVYNRGTSNNNGVDKEEKITVGNIYSFFKNKLFGG